MPDLHKAKLAKLAEQAIEKGESKYKSEAYEKAEAKFTYSWDILKDIKPIELLHFRCLTGLGKAQIALEQKDKTKETLRALEHARIQLEKISDPDVKQTICNSSYYDKDYHSLKRYLKSLEKPSEKRKHTRHRAAEKRSSTRHILLQEAPFLSTQLIVAKFNHMYELAKNEPSNNGLTVKRDDLSKVIRHILSRIDRTDPQTIEQALVIVACRDEVLVKALFEKLLTEIDTSKLNFKQLYSAISQSLEGKSEKSADNVVQMSQIITKKLNTVHAPDIELSSVMMYSLCQSLAEMRKMKLTRLALNTHKKPIEAAIQSLEQRLKAVKADTDEDKFVSARLEHAIALTNHALRYIKNHRTRLTRYAHRLKIGAMLFLQIAEMGGSVFEAVISCGEKTPAAASASWNLFSRAIQLTRQAWRHYRADKTYFEAVTVWEKAWLAIAESDKKNDDEKIKEQLAQLDALLSEPKKEKTYKHPKFCYEIIHRLWAVYSVCSSEVQTKIIEVLTYYYNLSKTDPKIQGFLLKRHAAQCLLLLAEQETHLKSNVESLISEKEQKVYKEARAFSRPSELYQYKTRFTDMALEAWSNCFTDDIDFYEGFTDNRYTEETRFAFVAMLQHKIRPALSYWGRALLATFPRESLEKTAKALGGYDHLANKIVVEKEAVLTVANKAYERKTSIQTGGKAITDPFMQQLISKQIEETNRLTDQEKQLRASDKAMDPALKQWEKPLAEVIDLKGRMNVYYTLIKTHVDFYSKSTDSMEASQDKKKVLKYNN